MHFAAALISTGLLVAIYICIVSISRG